MGLLYLYFYHMLCNFFSSFKCTSVDCDLLIITFLRSLILDLIFMLNN